MAVQIFINDEEVVCDDTITLQEEILSTSSTILNNCYPLSWETDKDYVSRFYCPPDYSLCTILENNVFVFAGVVKNTGNISLNPRDPHYCSLQILDFKTFLSEGECLDFVIKDKTITEAIEQVVNAIADYGVVLGDISILNDSQVIGAYSTLNKTPYDVFCYFADISGSIWTTNLINENQIEVNFYDPTLMPRGVDFEYTQEFFETYDIDVCRYSFSTNDYRNKQVMLSDEVFASIDYTENLFGDGYNKVFNTENKIGSISKITLNGVEKSFATKTEREAGITADFYYTIGEANIESETTLTLGSSIVINYIPLVPGRQIIYNTPEVDRIESQINRKGVVSRYENRNDVLSSDELFKVGQTYIKYKGKAEYTITISSDKNIWEVGQVLDFQSPIQEMNGDVMVKKKTTKIHVNSGWVEYEFEMTNTFNYESEINYFDNQRAKSQGNISQGDYIVRNIDIEISTLVEFKNLAIEEIAIEGSNELEAELEFPFNN